MYHLAGPELLTHAEQARIVGEVTGRPIRYVEIDAELARRQMTADVPAPVPAAIFKIWARSVEQPYLVLSRLPGADPALALVGQDQQAVGAGGVGGRRQQRPGHGGRGGDHAEPEACAAQEAVSVRGGYGSVRGEVKNCDSELFPCAAHAIPAGGPSCSPSVGENKTV